MKPNEAIRRFLLAIAGGKDLPEKSSPVALVLDVGSEAVQIAKFQQRRYALAAANVGAGAKALKLWDQGAKEVFGLVVTAGPLDDGTTANTNAVFLGGPDVTIAIGRPIAAGAAVELRRWVDLSELYVVGVHAGDVVRLSWYE